MTNKTTQIFNNQQVTLAPIIALLFIVWPLGSLALSIITINNRFSRIIFVLFWGLWGYSRVLPIGHDSASWTMEFLQYSTVSFNDFVENKVRSIGIESTDFLYSGFLFFLNKISNDIAIFWFINAAFFSYIYIRVLSESFKYIKTRQTPYEFYILLFIFLFFIPLPAYGVRYYYAALLLLLGLVQVILNKKSLFKIVIFITPLIHFSFIIPIVAYIYYELTKRKPSKYIWFLFIIVIITSLVVGMTSLAGIFEGLDVVEKKIEGYGDIGNRSEYYTSKSLFLIVDKFLYTAYSVFVLLIVRYKYNRKELFLTNELKSFNNYLIILGISLLFFINFLDVLDRFTIIFSLITILYFCIVYLINYQRKKILVNKMMIYGVVFWGFHIIVNLRRSLDVTSLHILKSSIIGILSNPLTGFS